jgi:hypothetical protein
MKAVPSLLRSSVLLAMVAIAAPLAGSRTAEAAGSQCYLDQYDDGIACVECLSDQCWSRTCFWNGESASIGDCLAAW